MDNLQELDELVNGFDLNKIKELRLSQLRTARGGFTKYLDFEVSMVEAIQRAKETGLLNRRGLDVLDLGAGAGYIPFVYQRAAGHRVIAVENNVDPFLLEMARLLSVDRRTVAITAGGNLPNFGPRFDWITGHNCTFDEPWSAEDYESFLKDLIANQLKPSGKIFLSLNYNYWNQGVIDRLKKCGCTVYSKNRVIYENR